MKKLKEKYLKVIHIYRYWNSQMNVLKLSGNEVRLRNKSSYFLKEVKDLQFSDLTWKMLLNKMQCDIFELQLVMK